MQNQSVSRIFNLRQAPRNIVLLVALLVSMLFGVAAGYYAGGTPVPMSNTSISVPNSSRSTSNISVSADALGVQELRQELRDLRQAQKFAKISPNSVAKPLDAYSLEKELHQEQFDLRHANAYIVPVQSDAIVTSRLTQMEILTQKERRLEPQISAPVWLAPRVGVTFPSRPELWQEHLDLLASRSKIGLSQTKATSVDTGASGAQSAYDLYWTAKAKQLK